MSSYDDVDREARHDWLNERESVEVENYWVPADEDPSGWEDAEIDRRREMEAGVW